ncbi:MAG TPA: 2-amino-4-hydroxy-6-hydroxymethyldihydropteridine diphosphokinase [Chloroflexia bacterium]|nr:2-amino-4-hydroxy-6-hydroxymethyldihydropteridine diphosphokinase [Chloroflexia bacterium]
MTAYLGLGSNMGDARGHVMRALTEIEALLGTSLERTSPMYGTKPWGKLDQPNFVNAVAEIRTTLSPRQLLTAVKVIERAHGRSPGERWGPRPLDIDILVYGDTIVGEPDLQVPHPRMWERGFVLRPLADLRPDLTGPDGRTIRDRLNDTEIADQEVWPLN